MTVRWTESNRLVAENVHRKKILEAEKPLHYAEVLHLWQYDAEFRSYFIRLLATVPFPAYFWETPPLTRATVGRAFEFVLIDSPALAGLMAERGAFVEHFTAAGPDALVASFSNLGHDALLIAPCPRASPQAYPHLAAFTREAPLAQQHAFWQAVGRAASERLSRYPLWISTSGLGVSWLHVRLDAAPKYYAYLPYRTHEVSSQDLQDQ